MPTAAQAIQAVILCQYLSNGYQPIHLFRYDPQNLQIFILAGVEEGIEIKVFEDGYWEFVENE